MAKEKKIAGIDIGTTCIRVVVGIKKENSVVPSIIGVGTKSSVGIRKGVIVDIEETVSAITSALEEAERVAGEPIDHAFISIGGNTIGSQVQKGVVAISRTDGEIVASDVDRVIEAAQNFTLPGNRQVLRVIPRYFTVDDQSGIKDPTGMSGIKLEVNAYVITAATHVVKNLTRCVNQTGVDIDDIIPDYLASSEIVLSKRQKELGVIMIDIGGGTVSLVVYEEGNILNSAVLPIGANHITNDIAIGLRTSIDMAEKLKLEYGTCISSDIAKDEKIDLSQLSNMEDHVVSRYQIGQIIEARMMEIFSLVYDELRKIDRAGMLPAGAIITGGGAKLPGIVDLAKNTLGLPAQVGFPLDVDGMTDTIDDPSFACAVGLLVWGTKTEGNPYSLGNLNLSETFGSVKSWFKSFLN